MMDGREVYADCLRHRVLYHTGKRKQMWLVLKVKPFRHLHDLVRVGIGFVSDSAMWCSSHH